MGKSRVPKGRRQNSLAAAPIFSSHLQPTHTGNAIHCCSMLQHFKRLQPLVGILTSSLTCCAPIPLPPRDRVKLCANPPFKRCQLIRSPLHPLQYGLNYKIKCSNSKLFGPLQHGYNLSPPPFCGGKTLLPPPLPCCTPPPPLPIMTSP